MLKMGEEHYLREGTFPVGEGSFPVGEGSFPVGEGTFLFNFAIYFSTNP